MAQAGKIYIGTSGWSYPKGEGTWAKTFYPAGTKDELTYYSQFFDTVEINSTFYRPPDARISQSWAKRTPCGFVFTAKLWQKFTHPKMYKEATGEEAAISQDDVDLFRQGIDPLARQGKLGALIAQFPPSFANDDYGRQILRAVLKAFGEYRVAVELRHVSWSDDLGTASLLRENNSAWVQIDEPKFNFSIAENVPQTTDWLYFRFHGRNKEMWWKGNAETRYQYLYSVEEISELADKVKKSRQEAPLAFAFFNNHYKAYAPHNAGDLMKALQLPFRDFPEQLLSDKD
jgi:uncharacterized protein YecE (DUF72 family)